MEQLTLICKISWNTFLENDFTVTCRNTDNQLQLTISGPGTIAGIGNAYIKNLDSYIGTARKVWHGRAQVVIKSAGKPGDITLTVNFAGLTAVTIRLKSGK